MTQEKNETSKPKQKIIETVCCHAMVKSKGRDKNKKYYCTSCGGEVTSKGKPKV